MCTMSERKEVLRVGVVSPAASTSALVVVDGYVARTFAANCPTGTPRGATGARRWR